MPTCLSSVCRYVCVRSSECVCKTTIVTSPLQRTCEVLESETRKPADYLGAPRGLPSLLHKLPQLNTSYSLALPFLSLTFLSCCYAFILHHRTPPAPSPLSHFSLVLLSSHSISSVLLSVFPFSLFPRHRANLMLHSDSCHPWLAYALTEGMQAGR